MDKFIIFYLTLLVGVPAGIALSVASRSVRNGVFTLMVACTCIPDAVGINFISREFYRANSRGFEITVFDLCAVVLFVAMLLCRDYRPFRWFPVMSGPFLLYVLVIFLSWLAVSPSRLEVPDAAAYLVPYEWFEIKLYPLFELTKVLRGFFIYLVVVNYLRDERALRPLLTGVVLAALLVTYIAVTDRYVVGIHRVSATLGHPNSLCTYMAMLGAVLFAACLQRQSLPASLLLGAVTAGCGLTVILAISRGGLAAYMLGLFLVWAGLFYRHLTFKNFLIVLVGLVIATLALAYASGTLLGRFVKEQDVSTDLDYRRFYNAEAKSMGADHPLLGVGMGNFSAYSWDRYAAEVDPLLPPGTPAHNNWYLTLGELGWLGVAALGFLWFRFYQFSGRHFFDRSCGAAQAMAVGAVAATVACQLQSLLQLGYRQSPIYFMLMILMGVAVGVRQWHSTPAPAAGS